MAYETFENKYGYYDPPYGKVGKDDYYDPPYGIVEADVPCPSCHEKPIIVKVWPNQKKYQIRCLKCDYNFGRRQLTEYGFYEWVPIFFDSIEEANKEWKNWVASNMETVLN